MKQCWQVTYAHPLVYCKTPPDYDDSSDGNEIIYILIKLDYLVNHEKKKEVCICFELLPFFPK